MLLKQMGEGLPLQGGYWNSNSYAENRSVSLRQSNYCTL